MAEVWFKGGSDHITFHDPLAAAALFAPDLCTYASGVVTVETRSEALAGLTHFQRRTSDARHQVAVEVDAEGFFRHYFEIVAG
jgi:inosine-uridine nucleoside N-ribohydrolase